MHYYFAPLEGITDRIFRQLHHKYFPGIDRYYTPFLSPTTHHTLTPKEQHELDPKQLISFELVPQILTKIPENFLWMAKKCADLGYTEINLNTGCPSGTVTAKGKGAGMLLHIDELDRFLDKIFRGTEVAISIKTRIGFYSADEFPALMDVFNRYPIKELTIHPRARQAFYSGDVDMGAFRYAYTTSKVSLCYNGDICSLSQLSQFTDAFPKLSSVMIGRGLVADPGMVSAGGTTTGTLRSFYEELLEHYIEAFGGARNAIFRMKEHWQYLLPSFENSEQLGKRLKKTTDIAEYRSLTQQIFSSLPLRINK